MASPAGPQAEGSAAPPARPLADLVICMVGPYAPRPGGVTVQVETLARCLRGDGVEVHSVDTNVQALRKLGRLGRWLLPLGQALIVPWRLWLATGNADLIHVHLASFWGFYLPMLAIALVRRLRHLPVVATYHGGRAGQFVGAQRHRVQALLRHVDLLLTPARVIGAVFDGLGPPNLVVPNVVGLDTSAARRVRPADMAANPAPLLLWIKRFDATGNPLLMVRAYALLLESIPQARLLMIGEGPRLAEAQALAAELAAPVEFSGRLSHAELLPVYAAADLFVSSSAVDIQPNTLLEASAAGLPMVATAVGGVPEMVHDGIDALLTPPDDPAALAQAMVRVLRQPGLAETLSRGAMANAERFTWPAVRPQLAAVYGSALGERISTCPSTHRLH